MEKEKGHEAILAAVNPLLGRGVFVFLKVPESWKLLKISIPPECNALGREFVGEGFRWITSGSIHALLVDEQKNQAYPFFLEVREFINDAQAFEFIQKRFQKLHNEESERVKIKPAYISDHEARCVIWVSRKKMFLKRKEVALAHLECTTYCNLTKRLLLFRVSSSRVEDFMRDEEKMLSILSSVTCHFSYVANSF